MRGALPALLLLCCASCRLGTGYVMREFSGCVFGDNKQGDITYIYGLFFNRQMLLTFSKEDNMFLPCSFCLPQMHQVAADVCTVLNTDPQAAGRMSAEESRCKEEVRTFWDKTVERRVKPSIEVYSPIKVHTESLPMLVCHVSGFYPSDIHVTWFRNNVFVRNYTVVVQTGEWTYQIVATLDLRNSLSSDNYTCLVEHSSLDVPIAKIWKHGLTNIQIVKISVSTAVFVIGLAILTAGFLCLKKSRTSGYTPIPGYNDVN